MHCEKKNHVTVQSCHCDEPTVNSEKTIPKITAQAWRLHLTVQSCHCEEPTVNSSSFPPCSHCQVASPLHTPLLHKSEAAMTADTAHVAPVHAPKARCFSHMADLHVIDHDVDGHLAQACFRRRVVQGDELQELCEGHGSMIALLAVYLTMVKSFVPRMRPVGPDIEDHSHRLTLFSCSLHTSWFATPTRVDGWVPK